jgi:drug/metabolite transporter superfamily protein YnfA
MIAFPGMIGWLGTLVLAATLEIAGVAAMRNGLVRSAVAPLLVGGSALVAYGLVVNSNRLTDFGRLMGTYIVVFFLVSQLTSSVVFGERPVPSLVLGGVLIVLGGLVIQLGAE